MKRFISLNTTGGLPTGGLPYVNTDFTEIFQSSHIISYSAMLESMLENDSYAGNNYGIVLSGCKITTANGSNFTMNFQDSVVYIDGEYYQNHPSLSTTTKIDPFYIIPGPTISETRLLRDLSTTATVSATRYFTFSTSLPSEPYIKFSQKGTSRYFKRLVKYFTSRTDDVYMTATLSNFNTTTGVGFNDMDGFQLLDSTNAISNNNLTGRFIMGERNGAIITSTGGADSVSLVHDNISNHTHQTFGPSLVSSIVDPSGSASADFNHYHGINTGLLETDDGRPDSVMGNEYMSESPSNFDTADGSVNGELDWTNEASGPISRLPTFASTPDYSAPSLGSVFAQGMEVSKDGGSYGGFTLYTGGIHDYNNSNLAKHTHDFGTSFGGGVPSASAQASPHENRPPYFVVAYYTKI